MAALLVGLLFLGIAPAWAGEPADSIDQDQAAANLNETDQEANAEAKSAQVNLAVPISVGGDGGAPDNVVSSVDNEEGNHATTGNGDVNQSNENEAEATNRNRTDQSIDQRQKAEVEDGRDGKGKKAKPKKDKKDKGKKKDCPKKEKKKDRPKKKRHCRC